MSYGEFNPNANTKILLHLNGNSNDASGNGRNGTDTNITYSYANGKFGQGAGFNGSSSKIVLPDVDYGVGTEITISAWVKTTASGGEDAILSRDNTGTCRCWQFRMEANGAIGFIRFLSTSELVNLVTSKTVNDGNWHHVLGTFSAAIGTKVYIDGKEEATNSTTTTTKNVTGTTPVVGYDTTGNADYFNGAIEEVILEASAWSAQKVRNYYNNTKGRFAPKMI